MKRTRSLLSLCPLLAAAALLSSCMSPPQYDPALGDRLEAVERGPAVTPAPTVGKPLDDPAMDYRGYYRGYRGYHPYGY